MKYDCRDADLEALVERTTTYVTVESPTGDPVALDSLAEILEADAASAGLTTARETHDTGDHLVWSLPARGVTGPPLLLLTHYDTVWPVGTLATMPLRRDDEALRGPGVFDTKSGTAVLLDAVERVVASGLPHPELRIVVVADEEVGSPSATDLVRAEGLAAFAVLGFEPPHPDGALKTARRGSTRVRLTATGLESHAGLDLAAGVNAIDELMDQLLRVRAALADVPVLYNVGTIRGGGRTNVVAGTASADLGMRFSDAETETEVLDLLRSLTSIRDRATLDLAVLSQRATWTAGQQPTADLLTQCARISAGIGLTVTGRPADGAADTNTTGALGCPTVDGLAPRGGGAHAAHEWVSLEGITERARLLPALLTGLRS